MIIDVHTHLLTNPFSVKEVEEVLDGADRFGIKKLCVASLGPGCYYPTKLIHEPTQEQCASFNADLFEIMKLYPDRIWGWAYINPAYPGAVDEVKRGIEEYGMIGVKMWTGTKCNDPRFFPVVEEAIKYGVPILQHTWDKVTGYFPNESRSFDVADLAEKYPEVKIVMAHNERAVLKVKHCPNVFMDTASPIAELGMIEKAVDHIGVDRLVFGSDCIGVDFASTIGKIIGSDLPEDDKSKILGENFLRILGRDQ
ncbi:amidohydrolase family protein [Neobacillus vireti]|uniref:Amidohydrolase 2 n=1 Tax=Neobacillus vireti LMG 21834 TaxID=1131730 RepID=A0AB94IPQ3_9BACI|nr:amidohydrolase family protein [Neobacillus vireti]ETI69049.1 amidohydrolase 2 [Neobacillus vireti LMG 21834]